MKTIETERLHKILEIVVENYIKHGKSEGSLKIVKKYGLLMSPATLRNALYDLQDMGYLKSIYTSSGKVPTEMGYKYYVDNILKRDRTPKAIVPVFIKNSDTLKTALTAASSWLSHQSSYLVAITAPELTELKLKKIDLINLDKTKGYLIIVLEYGWMISEIINTNEDGFLYLKKIISNLNKRYKNFPVKDIKDSIISDIRDKRARCEQLYNSIIDLYEKLYDKKRRVAISGIDNLLGMKKLNANIGFLKSLVALLEKKEMIANILNKAIDSSGSKIFIGKDNPLHLSDETSLIASDYNIKNNRGFIGMIGPFRMNYKRNLLLIDQAAMQLKWFIKRYDEEEHK